MPARIVRSHLGKPGEEMVRRKVQPFSGPIEENTYGTVPVYGLRERREAGFHEPADLAEVHQVHRQNSGGG
jgi:hypothetical protein